MKTKHEFPEAAIERYVRNGLGPDERLQFEEHLLECSQCFEQVQVLEQFVAGVRHAARTGLLAPATNRRMNWLARALAAALAVVFVTAAVWVVSLRRALDEAMQARTALQARLEAPPARASYVPELIPASLPIAVLTANRAAREESSLTIERTTPAIALWMDVEPSGRYRTFSVSVQDERGKTIASITSLTRNSEGAVAVIVPAAGLVPGEYNVELSGENPRRLLAQYRLRILKR